MHGWMATTTTTTAGVGSFSRDGQQQRETVACKLWSRKEAWDPSSRALPYAPLRIGVGVGLGADGYAGRLGSDGVAFAIGCGNGCGT